MDLITKGSETEDMGDTSPSKFNEFRKRCTDCQTTRTPCWRSGPAGPGTLCNACGIRLRKKRRAILGLDKGRSVSEISNKKIAKSSNNNNNNNNKLGVSLKLGLMGFRSDGLLQEDWRWKMGEEEQAAILLMALSCGSVCAASR